MKRIFFSLVLMGAVMITSAQEPVTAGVDSLATATDGKMEVYEKENIPFKRPITFAHVREADVAAEWTVWRLLDLRQRQNLPLYFPTNPKRMGSRVNLFELLIGGVESGELTAYDPRVIADEFAANQIRTYEQITGNPSLKYEDTEQRTVSPFTGIDTIIIMPGLNVLNDYSPMQLIVKEKWYFNRRLSRLECRVIGLQPIFVFSRLADDGGDATNYRVPVMWIYMDEARPLLARHPVYNDFNEAQNVSYDDFFMQHRYDGLIIKEGNIYDNRMIADYMSGLDVLHEAARIKDEIFNWEQDLWEY